MGKLIEDLHTKNLIYLIINKVLKAEKQCLTTQLNPTIVSKEYVPAHIYK
jgi:hypothetical protein